MRSASTDKEAQGGTGHTLDVEALRADFPILHQRVHGKPLVYFDNAATTQKPQAVIDTLVKYYREQNANIHRGVHYLSELATYEYEKTRGKIKLFLNAADTREIIFVRGTTEGINLVKDSFGRKFIGAGDEIVISAMEHHSNIVPWQLLCEEKGCILRVVPINDRGELDVEAYEALVNEKTKLVSMVYISNSLGTINPIKRIIAFAHARGVPVLVDGAQATSHLTVDVRNLDCDFFVMSGHKVFGPTGIGVLYGKMHLLESMPPYQAGGDMIRSVTFEKTTFNELPYKFEAGTPNVADVIALGTALDYVQKVGLSAIGDHENNLLRYATKKIGSLEGVRLIGTAAEKASVLSFVLDTVHAHDVGTILDQEGVAIRTGHHCTQPVMARFGVPATARASFAFYNTIAEIDVLTEGIKKVQEVFQA
ncbi:MAG: cysteine desulfurase [Ignavibacteriales bacterium]|nr:cysteine desulfurase [Ignavibacteriales bacterium]